MTNWQKRQIARPKIARQGAAHNCMNADGRAMHGTIAEGSDA